MEIHRRGRQLEAGSAIAVVVGLALVLYELHLSRVVARAELSNESAQIFQEILESEQSSDFSGILLKSRLSPKELTASERLQVRAFLSKVLTLYLRERYNYDRGIFETWDEYIYGTAPRYFGYGYGRAFLEAIKSGGNAPGPVFETIDLAVQNTEAVQFAKRLDELTLLKLDENDR